MRLFETDGHVDPAILHACAAQQLTPPERDAVDRHATACPACARALRRAVSARRLFAESSPPPLEPLALRRVRLRVERELRARAERRPRSRWAVAAAAALALMGGGALAAAGARLWREGSEARARAAAIAGADAPRAPDPPALVSPEPETEAPVAEPALPAPRHRPSSAREGHASLARDEIGALWDRASDAYYRERDLEAFASVAERLVAIGGSRPEARLAERLLCDATFTLDREEAVRRCERALDTVESAPEQRVLHAMLAELHRRRGACPSALPHYDAALVFGSLTAQDPALRLARATCALDSGDAGTAKRDLEVLRASPLPASLAFQVQALEARLPRSPGAARGESALDGSAIEE